VVSLISLAVFAVMIVMGGSKDKKRQWAYLIKLKYMLYLRYRSVIYYEYFGWKDYTK
jgi:hypothetical protein